VENNSNAITQFCRIRLGSESQELTIDLTTQLRMRPMSAAANSSTTLAKSRHQRKIEMASQNLGAFAPRCAILTVVGDMHAGTVMYEEMSNLWDQPETARTGIFYSCKNARLPTHLEDTKRKLG